MGQHTSTARTSIPDIWIIQLKLHNVDHFSAQSSDSLILFASGKKHLVEYADL
jgi:hypothetical protein